MPAEDPDAPRNAVTTASHGFLTRDGAHPSQLVAVARQQLATYSTVDYRNDTVLARDGAVHYAPMVRPWTDDVVVFTDSGTLSNDDTNEFARNGVQVVTELIRRLESGDVGRLLAVELVTGERIERDTGFSGLVAAAAEGAACAETIVHEIATERWANR